MWKSSEINFKRHVHEHIEKIKINLFNENKYLIQLLVSIISLFWFLIIHKDILQIF